MIQVIGISLVHRGEPGACVLGLGGTKFRVEVQGTLPVLLSQASVADDAQCRAEAGVRASLLVPVADLASASAGSTGCPGS